jgi:hypothetical protein
LPWPETGLQLRSLAVSHPKFYTLIRISSRFGATPIYGLVFVLGLDGSSCSTV